MFVVVSNVPGYLPEDDDPFVTDDLREANEYLRGEVDRYLDGLEACLDEGTGEYVSDDGTRYTVSWDGPFPDESWEACVVSDRPHDLGRVFEIMERIGDDC